MRRPTLGMFRAAGGSLPVGICVGDLASTANIVNLAQEQLIMDPLAPDEGWWGGWMRMAFNVISTSSYSYIVTPYDIARVILLDVCSNPIRLRNGFFEYLEFGTGLLPKPCNTTDVCRPTTMQAFERDRVVTLNDFASSSRKLRVYYTDPADVGKRIVFQGPDKNGEIVRAIDPTSRTAVQGETVYLAPPFSDTTNEFSSLTGIIKDATYGTVQVFMVDVDSGTATLLTTMEPNETTASYRRYMIAGLPCSCCGTSSGTIQVSAQCKLDFVPAYADSDYLCIPNIPAIMEQVQAIRYSRMDSADAMKLEAKHHDRAISLLNGQLDHYLGKVNTAVAVPIFGSDRLRAQPR